MTTPGSSGGSPLRIGGFALIGVGIVAGVIGLATAALGNNGGTDTSAAPTTSAISTPAPSPSPAVPGPTDGSVPVPSFGPTGNIAAPNGSTAPGGAPGVPGGVPGGAPGGVPGVAPGADGTGGTGAGGGGVAAGGGGGAGVLAEGGPAASLQAPVRVYNNSTITGLASRAAEDFRNSGWKVDAVSNYPNGVIPTSTVYYRPGTSEQSAAEALGSQFGLRVEKRFAGLDEATPGLIVIVTNDYQRR